MSSSRFSARLCDPSHFWFHFSGALLLGSIHDLEVDASDLAVTIMVHIVTVHECRGSFALSFACRDQG